MRGPEFSVPVGPRNLLGALLMTMSLVTVVVTWTPHGFGFRSTLNYGYMSVALGLGLSGAALFGSLVAGTILGRDSTVSQSHGRTVRILAPIATVTCLCLYLAVFAPLSLSLYPLAIGVAAIAGITSGWVG